MHHLFIGATNVTNLFNVNDFDGEDRVSTDVRSRLFHSVELAHRDAVLGHDAVNLILALGAVRLALFLHLLIYFFSAPCECGLSDLIGSPLAAMRKRRRSATSATSAASFFASANVA